MKFRDEAEDVASAFHWVQKNIHKYGQKYSITLRIQEEIPNIFSCVENQLEDILLLWLDWIGDTLGFVFSHDEGNRIQL